MPLAYRCHGCGATAEVRVTTRSSRHGPAVRQLHRKVNCNNPNASASDSKCTKASSIARLASGRRQFTVQSPALERTVPAPKGRTAAQLVSSARRKTKTSDSGRSVCASENSTRENPRECFLVLPSREKERFTFFRNTSKNLSKAAATTTSTA